MLPCGWWDARVHGMGDERLVWRRGSGWPLLLLDELGDILDLEVQVVVGSQCAYG